MLQLTNITKSFGGVRAIQGSTLSVEQGKVTALIGPNGAGKTTLFNIIAGLIPPDTGMIVFNEHDITKQASHERANLGISRTFQQVRLFTYLTIRDHLAMPESNEDTQLFRQLFARKQNNDAALQVMLDNVGIDRPLDAQVRDLSYGQQKLLELAMALQKKHTLLMLDEPVAGVNAVIQEAIEEKLLALKDAGETMLIIDHDMAFIRRLADHVIVLDAGVVLLEGPPEDVLSNPVVLEAYLGE